MARRARGPAGPCTVEKVAGDAMQRMLVARLQEQVDRVALLVGREELDAIIDGLETIQEDDLGRTVLIAETLSGLRQLRAKVFGQRGGPTRG